MRKVLVQQPSLADAINKCVTRNALITSDKLENSENIHCYKGALYYEDGCRIGENDETAYEFLKSQKWTEDAKWYVIGYFTEEDLVELDELHSSPKRYETQYFEKAFLDIVNQMTVKELKEVLDGMNGDAKIFCGLSEDGGIHKVTSYEYPNGDKSTWDFINLAHD